MDVHIMVDPIHIFNDQQYLTKKILKPPDINIVQKRDSDELFYLIKKSENIFSYRRDQFIINLEKSTEMIHPSIVHLSGFSIKKPYLYYEYYDDHFDINDILLTDDNIQKIFLLLASGLSILFSKGYCYSNFSIDSIIFDSKSCPKLIDYIDFEDLNNTHQNNLIIKYVDIMKMIIKKKMLNESSLILNEDLKLLIDKCQQKTNLPTFDDFIEFFKTKSYRANSDPIKFKDLTENLEQFYSKCDNISILNTFPDYLIKQIFKDAHKLSHEQMLYLYNEDMSLLIPNWHQYFTTNSRKDLIYIYKKLMKQKLILEKQRDKTFYFSQERKLLDDKIDAIGNQAIYFLKKAAKQLNDFQIKIELAVQYIKGIILPYNNKKALNILNTIDAEDKQTNQRINQIKEKIELSNKSIDLVPQDQKESLVKAEQGDVLSMIYVGFAFYTGFKGFPISRSFSIQYYRAASKQSADVMTLLGYFYLNGIIFPRNFTRACNCFKRAANQGCLKAKIIDGMLRKHLWRVYLLKFDINDLIQNYLQSFNSIIPNDSLTLPKIIYQNNLNTQKTYTVELNKVDNKLQSNKEKKNFSMFLNTHQISNEEKHYLYSSKILLFSENIENTDDVKKQMFIAKSYFDGENGFPVNYEKAAKFFKMAADKGNSEAQWRYAILCLNSIGTEYSFEIVQHYFQESIKQNDMKGKFYYSLFIKNYRDNTEIFEQYIKECCDSGDLDAIYIYAMHLEKIDESLDKSIEYYKKAADQGHFDSLIRLINLLKIKSQDKLYKNYLMLSFGIFNESFIAKSIRYCDRKKLYEQSNILLQIGIKINYKLFLFYYIDHLLYGKGMDINIKRAKKLAIFAFKNFNSYQYHEKYIYSMLQALVLNKEHEKALNFLLIHRRKLNDKYRKYFLLFYQKFDRKMCCNNLITSYFCNQSYIDIFDLFRNYNSKNINFYLFRVTLASLAKEYKNPYAMVAIGLILKHSKFGQKLNFAMEYFSSAVENGCPLGYYYIGKEYFYSRFLEQDYDKAKLYLLNAINNCEEPRSGFYLFKIPGIRNDENINDIELLKIGVTYKHKKALYTYGKLLYSGKDERIEKNESRGIELIKQAAIQKCQKAIKFLKSHHINYDDDESSIGENDSLLEYNSTEENTSGLSNLRNDSQDDPSDYNEFWI